MNMLKRTLALMLVLCMMFTAVPFNAFATESTDEPSVPTTAPVDAPESDDPEEVVDDTADNAPDAVTPDNGIATASLDDGIETIATTSNKPADGTASVPFPTNIMGSGHYRIPALITTNDGTLVAAADARWHVWDTTDDNGDIDTIVSYSTNNGSSWNYSFANYIDNGNTTNYNAATFIDPALAYDGETIYMIVDLYPGQSGQTNCTASSKAGTGYDSQGRLMLSTSATASFSTSNFSYYLDGGKICDSNGNDQGYTVDAWFNVINTSTGISCGNLFDYNNTCGFHPLMTSHLYLTKSTDDGKTWSAPQMLNHQIKGDSNTYYLVSPGRGFYDAKTGAIIFGAYDNSNDKKGAVSLIFSRDGGDTWERTANVSGISSENEIVQLEDGTLRMFLRHDDGDYTIKYVDATWNGSTYTWGSIQNTGVEAHNNTNVSAISYSKYSDGKQVILVSCPGATSGAWNRYNGKIYTFTVDNDTKAMELVGTYDVDSSSYWDPFSYSCMTELDDGTIGMLYEKGDSGNITYAEFSAETVTGLTFDTTVVEPEDPETETKVEASAPEGVVLTEVKAEAVTKVAGLTDFVAYDVTLTAGDGNPYTGEASVTLPLGGKFAADVELWGFVVEADDTITYVKENVVRDIEADTVTFTAPHFSTVGATPVPTDAGDDTLKDAIASNGASGPSYILDNDGTIDPGSTYVIVSNGNAFAMSNSYTASNVLVTENSNGTLTIPASSTSTINNALWTYQNSGLYNTSQSRYVRIGGSYLSYQSNTSAIVLNAQGNGVYKINRSGYNNRYLRLNGTTWTGGSSGQAASVKFYKYTAGGTPEYTIDAALQASRIAAATVANANYTDASWTAYQAALANASSLLAATKTATYATEDEAYQALADLINAVNALETAKANLKQAIYITVNYQADGVTVATGTLAIASDATTATLPATVTDGTTTYTVDSPTLTLTGATSYNVAVTKVDMIFVDTANTPFVGNTGVEGLNDPITGLVITTTTSYDLNVAGSNVIWGSTSDKFTVDQNGTVTGVTATDAGEKIYVTATVDGITYAIPVTVLQDSKSTTNRVIDFYNLQVANCTPYYSYQCEDLVEFPEGTQIYIEHDSNDTDILSFFATPDDGYALTYVNGTGGTWFHNVRNSAGTGYGYDYNGTHYDNIPYNQGDSYEYIHDQLISYVVNNSHAATVDEIHTMLDYAVAKKCDGAFFFSRATTTGKMNSSTTFIAEKLPEIFKVLSKVSYSKANNERVYVDYTEGMSVDIGYTLHYTLYVGVPEMAYPEQSRHIAYTNYTLNDPLTEDKWTVSTMDSETLVNRFTWNGSTNVNVTHYASSDAFRNSLTDGNVQSFPVDSFTYTNSTGGTSTYDDSTINVYAFNTSIELGASNFLDVVKDGTITNTANMNYVYQGKYSKGSTATASAAIVDVLVKVPEYVIDFGQSVTIDLAEHNITGTIKQNGATAKYGNVTVDGLKITYTPTSILQGTDFITLQFEDSAAIKGYGVRIYPATTVYYEEGFITEGGTWDASTAAKATANQTAEELSGKLNNYGYDPLYTKDGYTYGNTSISSPAIDEEKGYYGIGASTTFTFTGTGFDLYANCTNATGTVSVQVKNAAGKVVKFYAVNTMVGFTDIINNTDTNNEEFHLPIVSEQGLAHGTYTVTITKIMQNGSVELDGVRIFNTVKDSTVFGIDLEDNPEFYQLRNYVQKAVGTKSEDYAEKMPEQVYGEISADTEAPIEAVILDNNTNAYAGETNAQTLLDKGPKNELFLYKNQTLTFKVTTNREMQIGLKAPVAGTSYTLKVDGKVVGTAKTALNTSVDMFYTVAEKANVNEKGRTLLVSITNTGDKILSVTDLKICDDPSFAFAPLTVDDIAAAMGVAEEPEVPETPVEPEVPETTVEPEVEETTKPSKPGNGNKPGNNKPETTKPTKPTEPVVPETTTKPTEPEVPEVTVKPTEPQKPGKPGNNGNNKPAEPQKPGKDEKTNTLKITFVNMFGKKVGTATITTTNGVVSAYEIVGKAPAGRMAIWVIPVTLRANGNTSITVPVI